MVQNSLNVLDKAQSEVVTLTHDLHRDLEGYTIK